MLDLMTEELSPLGTRNVKNSTMFEQYVLVQERKEDAALKDVQLRDRHQALKEREQPLKEMKYKDRILRINFVEICAEDQA